MDHETFRSLVLQKRMYFDGGMGTLLQQAGLPAGTAPEEWNLSHPDTIAAIHRQYIEAGADFITTNTFGLAQKKGDDFDQTAAAAMDCARLARQGTSALIAFDIGPLGQLLKPFGTLPFEEAVNAFARCARMAETLGADVILIETMNDMLETKAALLAVKENSTLPVIVSNAYDSTGKLLTGADPQAMIAMLEGLGADAIGVNCSLGPKALFPIVKEYLRYSSLPVIVSPNAGLPVYENGQTLYRITAEEFAEEMKEMALAGAHILGGCCGTTPEFISQTVAKTREIPLKAPEQKKRSVISSYTHALVLGSRPLLVGERINPTGKKKIQAALRNHDDDTILSEGVLQADKGVHILDVNAGLPDIDERETLQRLVTKLQSVTDLPLQIDTADPEALEGALRVYAGKPLINSVCCKPESMEKVFPLAKKYGAAIIGLTIGPDGIPSTPEGRLALAAELKREAGKYGIAPEDLIVDPLALTISSDITSASVTLDSIRLIKKELGLSTSLGVSNISFGLPAREDLNTAFYAMALSAGLDLAIMNPFSEAMLRTYASSLALLGRDPSCADYIQYHSVEEPASSAVRELTLTESILRGLSDSASAATRQLLQDGKSPFAIIDEDIVGGLNIMGDRYEKGSAYLPQLLSAAEAASASFSVIRETLPSKEDQHRKIILATVQGDIHDIGKNIVKVILENFGFSVQDLGKDVPPETVAQAAIGCRLVGLSALMTTTVPSMEATIRRIRETSPTTQVVVGGAVLTAEYAKKIGADFYAADAMETVRIAQSVFSEQ